MRRRFTRSVPLVQTPCCTIPNSPMPSCLFTQIESAGMMCLLFGILVGESTDLTVSGDADGLTIWNAKNSRTETLCRSITYDSMFLCNWCLQKTFDFAQIAVRIEFLVKFP